MLKRAAKASIGLIFFFLCAAVTYAEAAWLAELPKAVRPNAASAFTALAEKQRRLREDTENAAAAEAGYARKARALARALDLSEEYGADSLAALGDLRRLRFESARESAENRFGRAGANGFESAVTVEASLRKAGAAFASLIDKHLPRMSRKALSSLAADMEARVESHPRCPPAAFSELRKAAAALGPAEKRLWIASLASGLPDGPLLAFADRLTADPGADAFSAALIRLQRVLVAEFALRPLLPAAAAAAWSGDAPDGAASAHAAAALSAGVRALADGESASLREALAEYPALDAAFSEFVPWLWSAFRVDPAASASAAGIDPGVAETALERAWRARGASAPDEAEAISPASVRAAERMAAFIESDPPQAELLAAFATLRTDEGALRAFGSGKRYASVRGRAEALYAPIAAAAEAGAAKNGLSLSFVVSADRFAPIAVAAREDGRAVPPERFAAAYALLVSDALGRRGSDPALDNVSWLEERRYFFTLPFLADGSVPDAAEIAALDGGAAFFPAENGEPAAAARRNALLRSRLRADAAVRGIPFRFVESSGGPIKDLAVFYSCAARRAVVGSAGSGG